MDREPSVAAELEWREPENEILPTLSNLASDLFFSVLSANASLLALSMRPLLYRPDSRQNGAASVGRNLRTSAVELTTGHLPNFEDAIWNRSAGLPLPSTTSGARQPLDPGIQSLLQYLS
jgi:hypothetical protein